MPRQFFRKLVKQALWRSRTKLVYARISLNKFTAIYFGVAILSCVVLSSLQGVAYNDNAVAGDIISSILDKANITDGLTFYEDGALLFCQNIPSEAGARCRGIRLGNSTSHRTNDFLATGLIKRDIAVSPVFDLSGTTVAVQLDATGEVLPMPCLQSLLWLRDFLRDSKREDVVTLLFQIWMLTLSLVTLLNESLPHLGASLASHVLGTAWAGYRVSNSKTLQERYFALIVNGTCDKVDIMGRWWKTRTEHTIPVIVLHLVALAALLYLSSNLFKVYANQSFSRVGASPEINKVYKLILLLSVCLQLVAFFGIAATGMWIDKIMNSSLRPIAHHLPLYLAAFISTAVLDIPWVILGWISVRRENRVLFFIFSLVSFFLIGISSFMFSSPLYRAVLMGWPFFAAMAVTAYVLLVATSILAIICRLHFGKGLAQFLRVTDALEGIDFMPVSFPKAIDIRESMEDKLKRSNSDASDNETYVFQSLPYAQEPKPAALPSRQSHALSLYLNSNSETLKLSTTPPVARSVLSNSRPTSTFTDITTSSVSTVGPYSLDKGSWRHDIPPVPTVVVSTPGTTPTLSSAETPTLAAPALTRTPSTGRRGLPTNPRPGSPVNVRVQKITTQAFSNS